ncbi:MAG: AMP-binding protein [Acidobacteriales bacterium]|nr:AMP-binding protein [Terriglobales bacterium]
MNLRLYHALPPILRPVAATVQGAYLRWWRYGRETERLVEEALEREKWSPEKWAAWQQDRLGYVLDRAATRVPYYRELWTQRRRSGDSSSWERIENWPILEKRVLRENPRAFVADDCDPRHMFAEHTSGTTGTPLSLWASRAVLHNWYALFEARCRRWYGVTRHDRWAILGGRLVTPCRQRKPPFWVWNKALNQLYMSSYHLAPDLIASYFRAIEDYQVRYLYGYPSALLALAVTARETGWKPPSLRVVITNAEPLYDYQRRQMEDGFQTKVRETYGMSEMVAAAGECESGHVHWWPDVGFTEIKGQEGDAAEDGELICTGLLNTDMPLIRYRVGDRVRCCRTSAKCECGRTLPLAGAVEGRSDDVIYTVDGRAIGRLDPVFKADLQVEEVQIVQEARQKLVVWYVPARGFDASTTTALRERLRERVGAMQIDLRKTDTIPRGPNGKFRAVICNLAPEERGKFVATTK